MIPLLKGLLLTPEKIIEDVRKRKLTLQNLNEILKGQMQNVLPETCTY